MASRSDLPWDLAGVCSQATGNDDPEEEFEHDGADYSVPFEGRSDSSSEPEGQDAEPEGQEPEGQDSEPEGQKFRGGARGAFSNVTGCPWSPVSGPSVHRSLRIA